MSQLTPELRLRVVAALVEANSVNAVARMTGVAKSTILRLLTKLGAACRRMHDCLVRDLRCHFIEGDEQWSFIQKKEKRVTERDDADAGDVFTYSGLDRTESTRAAAREVALAPPDVVLLREAANRIHGGWDMFFSELSSQLFQGGEDLQRAWVATLRGAIRDAVADTLGLLWLKTDREGVTGEIKGWQGEKDPFVIWKLAQIHVSYKTYPAAESRLLLELDRFAWLEELSLRPGL